MATVIGFSTMISMIKQHLSRDIWFPTVCHFDTMNRLKRACAAFFSNYMRGSRGGQGVRTLPLRNYKNIGFLRIPSKISKRPSQHKVGPSSVRQEMAFRRQADDGPLLVVFGSSLPWKTNTKSRQSCKIRPPLTKLTRGWIMFSQLFCNQRY